MAEWVERLPAPEVLEGFFSAICAGQTAFNITDDMGIDEYVHLSGNGYRDCLTRLFEGDRVLFRFAPAITIVAIYDHESERGPWRHSVGGSGPWPSMLDGFPDLLLPLLDLPWDREVDPAGIFTCTALAWRLAEDSEWHSGPDVEVDRDIELQYDDGVTDLLDAFLAGIPGLTEFVNYNFEIGLTQDQVEKLAGDGPLDDDLLRTLCPDPAVTTRLSQKLAALGYRIA